MRRNCPLVASALLVVMLTAQSAHADAGAVARAKRQEAEARKLFNLGRFEQAAAHYEKAYEARPLPALLYNLAQCYMRLTGAQNLARAAHLFRAYLEAMPQAPNRKAIEMQVSKLEAKLAAARSRAQPASPATQPGARAKATGSGRFYQRWWFWTLVGAAVIGSGIAVGVALGARDDWVPAGPEVPF